MERMKPVITVRPSARPIWLLALLAIYFGAFASGATRWISTLEIDAKWIEQMAETIGSKKIESSYAVMALLFAHTSDIQRLCIVIAAGVMFIFYCTLPLRDHRTFILLTFFMIAPILFFLMQFNKDTIVVFCILAAAAVMRSSMPLYIKMMVVAAIYTAYAYIFRPYYYLIFVVFSLIVFMRRMPPLMLISLFFLGLAVAALLPDSAFSQLQASRDVFNIDRLGRDLPGVRTAFGNLIPPKGIVTFAINYAYAFARLNFPFFSGVTPRDIYLFANVILFSWLVVIGLRSDSKTSDSTALFLSHVLVSICFEPDTGSYLRHVSSALPYLVPALVVLDGSWTAQDQLAPRAAARAGAYPRR